MPIITSTDYPVVRAALDTSFDITDLPDAVIGLRIYHAAAEREVKKRIPNAETLTGDSLERVKDATIYLIAARLAPSVPRILAETMDDGYQYQRANQQDWAKLAAELRRLADAEITEALQLTAPNLAHFKRGLGGRGR